MVGVRGLVQGSGLRLFILGGEWFIVGVHRLFQGSGLRLFIRVGDWFMLGVRGLVQGSTLLLLPLGGGAKGEPLRGGVSTEERSNQ